MFTFVKCFPPITLPGIFLTKELSPFLISGSKFLRLVTSAVATARTRSRFRKISVSISRLEEAARVSLIRVRGEIDRFQKEKSPKISGKIQLIVFLSFFLFTKIHISKIWRFTFTRGETPGVSSRKIHRDS